MPVEIIDPLNAALRVLRTIQAPDHVHQIGAGTYRISSAAFRLQSDGSFSVDLEESLSAANLPLTAVYGQLRRAVALAAHPVGALTQRKMTVQHVPVAGNDHHGEVRGDGLPKGVLRSIARELAETCALVCPVDVGEVQRLAADREG